MLNILTTSFNASPFLERCINSMKNQSFKNWKCYITDDMSTDGSVSYIESLIENDHRFKVIANQKKMWQPGNYWQILQNPNISDQDVIITVDLDDWLPDNDVFKRINALYESDKHLWMTYGQFAIWNGDGLINGFAAEPNFDNLRGFSNWTLSHLRTFKAFLFRKISKEDLIGPDGQFWESAGDIAFMLPMIEMAGKENSKFLSEVNYVYNNENPLNDHKQKVGQQLKYRSLIQAKKPYSKLVI